MCTCVCMCFLQIIINSPIHFIVNIGVKRIGYKINYFYFQRYEYIYTKFHLDNLTCEEVDDYPHIVRSALLKL